MKFYKQKKLNNYYFKFSAPGFNVQQNRFMRFLFRLSAAPYHFGRGRGYHGRGGFGDRGGRGAGANGRGRGGHGFAI